MSINTKTFLINIFSCLFVTIHNMSTNRAYIRAVRKLKFLMDMTTCKAGLTGREPFTDEKNQLSFSGSFIKQHVYEHAPAVVTDGLPKMQGFLHGCHIQVFNSDQIISIGQHTGQLVQPVASLMLGFRMQLGDGLLLLHVITGTKFHMGQFPLFLCDFGFHLTVRLFIIGMVAKRVDVQARQGHIQSDVLDFC